MSSIRIQKLSVKLFVLAFLSTICYQLSTNNCFSQGIGININGKKADAKALLDIDATGMSPKAGLLVPRMTTAERNTIASPVPESLLIYNTDTHCFEAYYNNSWVDWACLGSPCQVPPAQPDTISGTHVLCQNATGVSFSVPNVPGVTYTWTYSGTGFTIATGSGNNSITADFSPTATSGILTVTPMNACGTGATQTYAITVNSAPDAPTATALTSSSQSEIEWIWGPHDISGQWSTTPTYPGIGVNTASWWSPGMQSWPSYTQTGLACGNTYNLYVWTSNSNGCHSPYTKLTQNTVCACSGTVTTFAGIDGNACYAGSCGDGGPATSATINEAYNIAIDASGNVYIADGFNFTVRKVNTSGIISTVAGIGNSQGYSGDGGQATAAKLHTPVGVAVDLSGNIYITDEYNWVIRKVTPSGIISTFAGNGTAGYSGDGGQATDAQLEDWGQIACDASGNVYFAEESGVIRKVTVSSGIISTVTGNNSLFAYNGDGIPATSAYLSAPTGVALDPSGNIYIAESNGQRIRKVDASTHLISTIAGSILGASNIYGYTGDGGPATAAQLYSPWSVSVDNAGNVYIADLLNFVIRKVNTSGIICTFAGSKIWTGGFTGEGVSSVSTNLNYPYGVAVNSAGNIVYIANSSRNNVRKVTIP